MGTFICYTTIPNKELKKIAKDTIRDLGKWFKNNPERKDCNAELWYGKRVLISRGKEKEAVGKFLKESLKDTKTIRTKRVGL